MHVEPPVYYPMRLRDGSQRRVVEYAGAGIVAASVIGLLVLTDGAGAKPLIVVIGGLIGVSALACLRAWPVTRDAWLLLALAGTLSISVKFHPVYRMDHIGGAIGLRVSLTEFLVLLIVALALPRALRAGAIVIQVDRAVASAACAYLVWAGVSTAVSEDAALGVFQLSAVLQALVLCTLIASVRWTRRTRQFVVAGLLCGLVLQSSAAVVQAVRPGLLSLDFLGASEDTGEGEGSAVPEVDLGTTRIAGEIATRPTGLLIHPNVLGAYFVLTIPLALAVWLTGPTRWERTLALVAGAMAAGALYLSLSRSGWIGTAFAIGLGGVLAWKWELLKLRPLQKLALAAAAVMVLGGVAMKADRIYLRLVETAGDAVQFRRDLALTAWEMTKDNAVTGVGLNTFIYHAEIYDASGTSRLKRFPVHNAYLLELAETGIPGGLAFLALVAAMLWKTFASARGAVLQESAVLVLALASGIAGFWLTQVSDYVYRIPILTSLVWAHAGLALGLSRERVA